MDVQLDFDPSQYTRLPPYLDSATTMTLGRQLVAAAAGISAPAVKRSTATLSRATQQLADGMADTLGLAPSAQKRPIDQAADHCWSGIELRLRGWLQLPAEDYAEVDAAQTLHSRLFPEGLSFTQLEYGAQWAEADARVSWLKQAGQLTVLEALIGKSFVTELLRTHTAYGQMVGTDPKKRAQAQKRPDLPTLRKRTQQAILAHQIQLVALRVSGEEVELATQALRPVDEYREKLAPTKSAKKEDPEAPAPTPVVDPEPSGG